MEQTIGDRIKILVQKFGGSNLQFANILGVNESNIRNYISGTQPKFDILQSIVQKFEINAEWLLTGEGDMIKSADKCDIAISDEHFSNPVVIHASTKDVMIPIYNAEASAGTGALRLNKEYIIGEISVPFARKGDIALTTVGNSMQPIINGGDLLVVRERYNWREHLEPGKLYVIVTDEEIYVKIISEVFNQSHIILHSYNPEYGDFSIPQKCIHGIFKVIGFISQRSY